MGGHTQLRPLGSGPILRGSVLGTAGLSSTPGPQPLGAGITPSVASTRVPRWRPVSPGAELPLGKIGPGISQPKRFQVRSRGRKGKHMQTSKTARNTYSLSQASYIRATGAYRVNWDQWPWSWANM